MKTRKSFLFQFPLILFLITILPASGVSARSKYDKLLQNPDSRQKLEILAMMEEKSALTSEIRYLIRDPDPLIRLRCAEVLGRADDPIGTILYLSELVRDENPDVVRSAVYSLGLTGYREKTSRMALESIASCLKDQPKKTRLTALRALGMTHLPGALPLIKPYLKNFHSAMRAEAAIALSILGDSTSATACVPSLLDAAPHVVAMSAYTMGRLGYDRESDQLISLLASKDTEVRLRAAEALGRLKKKKAVAFLAVLTGDENRMVAIKATEALSRIGGGKSIKKLEKLLSSSDSYIRTIALQGIEAAGKKKSFRKVAPLLNDKSLMVRIAAIKAAAMTGGKDARDDLVRIFRKSTPYERMTAIEYLGEIGFPEDLELLTRTLALKTSHLAKEGAAAGLGRWNDIEQLLTPAYKNGPTPAQTLLDAAAEDDWIVATMAIDALSSTMPEKVIDEMIAIFNNSDKREDADKKLSIIRSFASLADDKKLDDESREKIIGLLRTSLLESDPRLPQAAAKAASGFGLSFSPDSALKANWDRGFLPWKTPALPLGDIKIAIVTSRGRIEIVLFGDDAPDIVRSILGLAKEGFYDGLNFHRVVPGFVIQGGCPRGDGWGDAGYFLRSQFNMHSYEKGFVGMAHNGKDTPGSQFFITHTFQPHLDGRYTIIGRVTSGMEIVDKIETGDIFSIRICD